MDGPLSGYRVLDLTDDKGMLCARVLSDMGAGVIRLEKPRSQASQDPAYCYLNTGKHGITLDLEIEKGRELFRRLVKTAHIVVEDKPPGYLDELGLGYAELREINPGLVMASVTGFGQNGPYSDYKSCDMVVSALGGQMYVNGEPETPPLKPYGDQTHYSASLFAAIGIMLALWNRHTTGKGQHIDVSAMDCATATLDHVLVRYLYEGTVAERQGSRHWNNAFRVFPCRDGYILLSLLHQWETMVEWLDAEGMAEDLVDVRWLSTEARLKHIDHIIEIMERWTQSHTVAELVEKGQMMHFPWAEVTSIPQLVGSPQLAERNFFVNAECSGKKYRYPGTPCKLSRSPWKAGGRAPDSGEHNLDIYHRELRLSLEELDTLTRDGVI